MIFEAWRARSKGSVRGIKAVMKGLQKSVLKRAFEEIKFRAREDQFEDWEKKVLRRLVTRVNNRWLDEALSKWRA
jgi:hypothetical protein